MENPSYIILERFCSTGMCAVRYDVLSFGSVPAPGAKPLYHRVRGGMGFRSFAEAEAWVKTQEETEVKSWLLVKTDAPC